MHAVGKPVQTVIVGKNDEKEVAERLDWIAFKNQFFSSVFLADADFVKTKLSSKMETQGSGYIKDYSCLLYTSGGKLRAMIVFCGQASSHLRQDLHLLGSM